MVRTVVEISVGHTIERGHEKYMNYLRTLRPGEKAQYGVKEGHNLFINLKSRLEAEPGEVITREMIAAEVLSTSEQILDLVRRIDPEALPPEPTVVPEITIRLTEEEF